MFSFNNLVGQISPQFDDMWVIQRDISDEFNEEKLDNDKWMTPPPLQLGRRWSLLLFQDGECKG